MPNLLAHIGAQGILSRSVLRRADAKWVLLGCMIPDIPWILQRGLWGLGIHADLYDLRLYAITQASLAGCLILSAACAALAAAPGRTFLILALNSFLHLLLDAMQTKWANGVHFFAPFSWELVNFGWFWPESLPSVLLTCLGLVVAGWLWWRPRGEDGPRRTVGRTRLLISAALALAYVALPFLFWQGPERADNHFVHTLREVDLRPGRPVEFDRNRCIIRDDGAILRTFTGEELKLLGSVPDTSGTISVRARFRDSGAIEVQELHVHSDRLRDAASLVGLCIVIAFWARAGWLRISSRDLGGRAGT